jgi:hypothetical protein
LLPAAAEAAGARGEVHRAPVAREEEPRDGLAPARELDRATLDPVDVDANLWWGCAVGALALTAAAFTDERIVRVLGEPDE